MSRLLLEDDRCCSASLLLLCKGCCGADDDGVVLPATGFFLVSSSFRLVLLFKELLETSTIAASIRLSSKRNIRSLLKMLIMAIVKRVGVSRCSICSRDVEYVEWGYESKLTQGK